jgi:hypothetical protein
MISKAVRGLVLIFTVDAPDFGQWRRSHLVGKSETCEFKSSFLYAPIDLQTYMPSGRETFLLAGAMQNSDVQSRMPFPTATEHGWASWDHRTLNRLE